MAWRNHHDDPQSLNPGGATHVLDPELVAELEADAGGVATAEPFGRWRPGRGPIGLPPDWWRCLRVGPVSGRYLGEMISPRPGTHELDLRVDIDVRDADSPVMDKVSGDVYRVYSFTWGGRVYRWRVFQHSWIVQSPHVRWSRCDVVITGTVHFWTGAEPPARLELVIGWGSFKPAGPARARLARTGSVQEYECARRSDHFRDVTLEVDVTRSVDTTPTLPRYDSHAHPARPAGLRRRDLSVERCYEEAGIDLAVRPQSTVIDDSDPQFNTWSPAELHDAMETHFSQHPGGWPKWQLWGLLCGSYQRATTAGVMFDARAAVGGAGEAPERQGFAVFRHHPWFDTLPDGEPASADEAWALRQFLYTWVHEAGHAFNFLHSWDKGRPSSLSWMNYPHRVAGFWSRFELRFDDEELIHIRHGDRPSVIFGGDAWASGGHFEADARMGVAEGDAPLELIVRSKPAFAFMEEVRVELRLRNLVPGVEIPIDERLHPRFGAVAVYVMRPDGRIVEYHPVFCEVGDPKLRALLPAGTGHGLDRFSREVSLDFGASGHLFATPGEYRIRAVYRGDGSVLIPSPLHTLRVGVPRSPEEDALACDYFSFDAGFCMALGGSRSAHLRSGRESLERVAAGSADPIVRARVETALAEGLSRPFFAVEPDRRKLIKSADANPAAALQLTEDAVKSIRESGDPGLNLAYHDLVRRRVPLLAACEQGDQARRECETLRADLERRGVKRRVLDEIEALAASV